MQFYLAGIEKYMILQVRWKLLLPPFPYPSDESSRCYNSSCTDSIDGTGYFIRMFENFNGVSAVMFFLSTLWISVIRGDFCYFSLRCRKGFQIGCKSKPFFYFCAIGIIDDIILKVFHFSSLFVLRGDFQDSF